MQSLALRNWRIAAGSLILALMTALGPASPALAHESVSEQYPTAGQSVDAGETQLKVVFTGDLLVLPDASGIELEVTDPSGQQVRLAERGCLVIGSRGIEAVVELDQPGEYRVSWQVTAGDGHPLSESFSFRLENPSGFTAATPLSEIRCDGNRLPDGSIAKPSSDSGSGITPTGETLLGVSTNVWLAGLLGAGLTLVAALAYLLLKPGRSSANRN